MKKSWKNHEKVMINSWENQEEVMRKSWESHEKIMRKSWESLVLCYSCGHGCSCLFNEIWVNESLSNRVATRPWLAFQAKAMVKRWRIFICPAYIGDTPFNQKSPVLRKVGFPQWHSPTDMGPIQWNCWSNPTSRMGHGKWCCLKP